MNDTQKSVKRTASDKPSKGFTTEEKAAMRERARELKAATSKADAERELLEKIAEMPESDRVIAERIDGVIRASAPELAPRLWYGMPAYAKDGKIVCFFQPADKFKSRYATFGFNEDANLDDGQMWPTSWALTKLTDEVEAAIRALVKKAVS